jgi:hypothetical protein
MKPTTRKAKRYRNEKPGRAKTVPDMRHRKSLLFPNNVRIEMNVFDFDGVYKIEVRRIDREFHGGEMAAHNLQDAKWIAVEWAASEARQELSILEIGHYAGQRWEVSEDRWGSPLNFVYR